MILVDFNQIVIGNFMMQVGNHTNIPLDEGILRHMILNALRYYRNKFHEDYGELVICCDSKRYWRKEVFPYYKAGRKKDRQASGVDWSTMFTVLDKVRQELIDVFPYRTMIIEGAEADDIIGTIVGYEREEKILILSSDKDFVQLHVYNNVEQYSPVLKKFVRHENPKLYLREHIIKGDRSDGIPNIMSADSVFVNGGRQKPIRRNMIAELARVDVDHVEESDLFREDEHKRNWLRNRQLVDLKMIPSELRNKIERTFVDYNTNDRSKLFNYFVQNKLNNLMENINEF
jgi:5'-3' exonuclease